MKRQQDQENAEEEEVDEEDVDESLAERVEEARNVLERLDEIRRDSKEGKYLHTRAHYLAEAQHIDCLFLSLARLDDEMLTQLFRMKLLSSPCQNQGYVLDGYPKTLDQALSLFGGKLSPTKDTITSASLASSVGRRR